MSSLRSDSGESSAIVPFFCFNVLIVNSCCLDFKSKKNENLDRCDKPGRGKPPGIFGSLLLKEELFLVPALDLESPLKWWDWRRRLHAFAWLKRRQIKTKGDMYDAWHLLKFLCQEVDERRARELGHEIAELPKHASQEEIRSWKRETLFLLRRPSDIKRIETAMNKHYAYYRKHINPDAGEMVPPDREMAKYKFVAELLQMEKKAVLEDFLFAGTPVIYRGR